MADVDETVSRKQRMPVSTPEMAVSRPLPGDDEQTFEFEEEGGLGITFVKHDACEPGSELRVRLIIVLDVVADSAAARIAALRAGLVLSSVQDQPVAGLGFKATMDLIKAAGRPLRLGFATDDDGALRTVPSAELEQTQAQAARRSRTKSRTQSAEPQPEPEPEDDFGFAIGSYFSPRTHAKVHAETHRHLEATRRTRSRTLDKWKTHIEGSPPVGAALAELARRGVPPSVRTAAWPGLSSAMAKQAAVTEPSAYYAKLVSQSDRVGPADASEALCNALEDLEKDLDRTFPGHRLFSSPTGDEAEQDGGKRAGLRRVLGAYAVRNESVGYCQSMNFVAASLLLALPTQEEEAFWVLCALVEDSLPEYYTHTMSALKADADALGVLVERLLPDVAKTMERHGVGPHMLCVEWFLKIFVTVLPFETVLRLWDCLLLAPAEPGGVVLLAVALSVLSTGRRRLVASKTATEFMVTVRRCCAEAVDADALLKRALDKKMLARVRKVREDTLTEAGLSLDSCSKLPVETVSVPTQMGSENQSAALSAQARSCSAWGPADSSLPVALPPLQIVGGSSSSPQCQRADGSAQSVTAPAAGQSDAAAPWRADSDNHLRCGTLRMSSRSAEGEKKWFVLRRGLEPFYPPQLEIFDFFADEPEPPTAVAHGNHRRVVLLLDKATVSTAGDEEVGASFWLRGHWSEVSQPLELDAGSVDNRRAWVAAIESALHPGKTVADDGSKAGLRRRSLSWHEGMAQPAASPSASPPPPVSPLPSPPQSPPPLPEEEELLPPPSDSPVTDQVADKLPEDEEAGGGLRSPIALQPVPMTSGAKGTRPAARRRDNELLKEGTVLLASATDSGGRWGSRRWESSWLQLNSGVEPWFGAEIRLAATAQVLGGPRRIPLDECELEWGVGAKHGVSLGGSTGLLLDFKTAACREEWKAALHSAASAADEADDKEGNDENEKEELPQGETPAGAEETPEEGEVDDFAAEGFVELYLLDLVRKAWSRRWVALQGTRVLHAEAPLAAKDAAQGRVLLDLADCVALTQHGAGQDGESSGRWLELELRCTDGKCHRMRASGRKECETWTAALTLGMLGEGGVAPPAVGGVGAVAVV